MFPKVDSLPGSEREASVSNRNVYRRLGQNTADVRGHIVGAFATVTIQRVAVDNQPRCDPADAVQSVILIV